MASYKNVDEALERGELWRAKEILRGRVASSQYDPVLFERYGAVLLAAADLFEAGKFLFLSGARTEAYAQAISVFLGRYATGRAAALFYALPRSVQKTDMTLWPTIAIDELRNLGIDVRALQRVSAQRVGAKPVLPRARWWVRIQGYLIILIALMVFLTFMVGVVVGVKTIAAWFMG